jgi:hypothetical protein
MMNTIRQTNGKWFLQDAWRNAAGKPEVWRDEPKTLEHLAKTQWSAKFEQYMRNRLIMGALRYGKLHEPGKPKYNRVASAIKRLAAYQQTGNKEHLIDVANLMLLEFEECHHPFAHFNSVDDGQHTKEI